MGVVHEFQTGNSYIDGTLVTDENHDRLVAINIRKASLIEIKMTRNYVANKWPGVKECAERDRIVALLEQCLKDVEN